MPIHFQGIREHWEIFKRTGNNSTGNLGNREHGDFEKAVAICTISYGLYWLNVRPHTISL